MSSFRGPRVSRDLFLSCAFFSGPYTPHPSLLDLPALPCLAQASPLWEWAVCTWLFEALFSLCSPRGLPIALGPCGTQGYEEWGYDSLPGQVLVQMPHFSLASSADVCHTAIIEDE